MSSEITMELQALVCFVLLIFVFVFAISKAPQTEGRLAALQTFF